MASRLNLQAWIEEFKNSLRGKAALNQLNRKFSSNRLNKPTILPPMLQDNLLTSCYCAAMFNPNGDPDRSARTADGQGLNSLDTQRRAIRILRDFIREHKNIANIALGLALIDLKNQGIGFASKPGLDDEEKLDRLLEGFSLRLVEPIPFVESGPLLKRFSYGCLLYDTPLDDDAHNNPTTVETMLLFDLVQTLRLCSNGIYARQTGEPMPTTGKPRYSLAAALVSATFKDKTAVKAEDARNRLKAFIKRNPKVGYYPWPILRDTS